MKYQEEKNVQKFYDEGKHVFDENNAELDFFGQRLMIDIPAYQHMLNDGALKFYSLRADDNSVLGYGIFVLYHHTHYQGMLMAEQDSLFITKKYRVRALAFINWMDKQLKEAGVHAVMRQVPKIKDWSLLLNRLNYEEIETVYMKKLKE